MRGIGAIILAAGGSTRFGAPKQLLEVGGTSLVRRAVEAAIGGGCEPVVVVAGAVCAELEDELRESPVEVVFNSEWERGIGTSIRCGLQHLLGADNDVGGVVLLACDQPFVDARLIGDLIAAARNAEKPMSACRYANTLGIPAFFDCLRFRHLQALADDAGAKNLITRSGTEVAEVAFERGAIDIDTPADFQRLSEQSR